MTLSTVSTIIKMAWIFAAVLLVSLSSTTMAFAPLHQFSAGRTTAPFHPRRTSSSTLENNVESPTGLEMQKKKGTSGGKNSSSAAAATKGFAGAPTKAKSGSGFPYAGTIRPGRQSAQKTVTIPSIIKPDYWKTGIPGTASSSGAAASTSSSRQFQLPWMIEVKNAADIEKMRAAGSLARDILDLAGRHVQEGVTTDKIDEVVHEAIIAAGAYPSPLNYRGFPKSCCTSVNEVICHGIPDDRPLQCGDVVNLDITVHLNGYHGDCSEMFVVTPYNHVRGSEHEHDMARHGKEFLDDQGQDLLQTTYDCWILACQFVQPGRDYKDIGAIIEDHVVPRGFSTVRNFCGHGIGQTFHTNPNILHYRNNEPNGQMAPGHTFTIEPMICEGSAKALTWPDNWTATTVDGKRSAQFEHTLLVTPAGSSGSSGGVQALTGKKESSPVQFWELESKIHSGVWLGTSPEAKQRAEEINQKLKNAQQ